MYKLKIPDVLSRALGLIPKVSGAMGKKVVGQAESPPKWTTSPGVSDVPDWSYHLEGFPPVGYPPLNCRCYYCRNKLSTPHGYVNTQGFGAGLD